MSVDSHLVSAGGVPISDNSCQKPDTCASESNSKKNGSSDQDANGHENDMDDDIPPFSLLTLEDSEDSIQRELRSQISCERRLLDAYPCTPLQEGLFALSMKQEGTFIPQIICKLPADLDIARLKAAWQAVVQANSTLRTQFVQTSSWGMIQVVLDPIPIAWREGRNLAAYLSEDRQVLPNFGAELLRFGLIDDAESMQKYFVWTFHHSLIDGWAMRLLLKQVDEYYIFNSLVPLVQFKQFITHINEKGSEEEHLRFWSNHLSENDSLVFPRPPTPNYLPSADSYEELLIHVPQSLKEIATTSTIIQSAWSILLARLTKRSEATFGLVLAGRSLEIPGIKTINGPTFTTVPIRVKVDGHSTVCQLFEKIHRTRKAMKPHQHIGLQKIRRLGPEMATHCDFQNMLVIQPRLERDSQSLFSDRENATDHWSRLNAYSLMMQCDMMDEGFAARASFDSGVVSTTEMKVILEDFRHVVDMFAADTTSLVERIKRISEIQQPSRLILDTGIERVASCVHEVIAKVGLSQSCDIAVTSWDGDLSYGQLQEMSDLLAVRLRQLGVGPEVKVAIVFEKSLFVIVAIMAMMKAGGVFVPMDPSHPKNRIKSLVDQIGGTLLLCSESLFVAFNGIAKNTLIVSWSGLEDMATRQDFGSEPCSNVGPDNAVYIIFTSGSTGKPKGCIIEHGACCTTMQELGKFLGMDRSSRVLQLSSYTFDACILEILVTLGAGGTICIPSDEEKMNNIAAAMNRMDVNLAFFTPSFARLISPDSLLTLKTLSLGGEKLVHDDLDRWVGRLRLLQGYGPTECCVVCIGNEVKVRGTPPSKIGKGFIGSYMVLDEDLQIAEPGIAGELYIGGPHLARGYLCDLEKTQAAFVRTPETLAHLNLSCDRWYKTGDLAKQDNNGEIDIIGRRDAQVKLRGQRIELGEVEYHVRRSVDDNVDIAAVVATPFDDSGPAFLAVYIALHDLSVGTIPFEGKKSAILSDFCFSSYAISTLLDKLYTYLPVYMIPNLFIPLTGIPLTTSGKVDRKLLQMTAADLTKEQHRAYSGRPEKYANPTSEKEVRIQNLWAKVLKIDSKSIGRYDNFVRLGGDSILAMKLVTLAREEGVDLTVRGLFKSPNLFELAKHVSVIEKQHSRKRELQPFGLIGGINGALPIVEALSQQEICMNEVADIYPCTPFQEGIMALSITHPGSYVAQYIFELSTDLSDDISLFCSAWNQVFAAQAIFRTRIIHSESAGLVQLVSKEPLKWKFGKDLRDYLKADRADPMGMDSPLSRHAIIRSNSEGGYHFVWTMHHAIYDAWSMNLVVKDFEQRFQSLKRNGRTSSNNKRALIPFNTFVENVQTVDFRGSTSFWLDQLNRGEPVHFPAVPMRHSSKPSESITRRSCFTRKTASSIRTSTLVRAAWAIVLSSYTHSNDVVFGATLSGRTGIFENLPSIVGPTITTVPIRIILESQISVAEQLRRIEDQTIQMMPFEQTGLPKIKKMDVNLEQVCDFQNLLVIQPRQHSDIDNSTLGHRIRGYDDLQVFDTYALTMECTLTDDGLKAKAIFDPIVIAAGQMKRILFQFEHVLQRLCLEETEKSIREINTVNVHDLAEVWDWNAILPESSKSCVHHLIEEKVMGNPNAPAICSWDGDLTRDQLDILSSNLAQKLIQHGVGVEDKIPILFEKSKWAVVAIMAIIKAGAAFLPLDPLHPIARNVLIIEQTNAKLILCSAEQKNLGDKLLSGSQNILAVHSATTSNLRDAPISVPIIGPENALYVIFTSGTTGTPKGTLVEHGAYCAGAKEHAKALGFSESSRLLQFASYSFDTSVEDILTTLMTGGCLCIPSEEERISDLASAISRMSVNAADLTSSLISSLSPAEVPSLMRVTLGGEPLTPKVLKIWADKVQLINAYGTTECCVTSLVNSKIDLKSNPGNIGRAVGAVAWVVDPEDANLLVPIGAIGELLIEGPAQARGYINDEAKTNAVFIRDPKWALETHRSRRPGRLYKTGDLVRYNTNGTIHYLGRKDTQVKLRGQRIELGEIEHHLSDHPNVRLAVVLLPSEGPYKGHITALVEFDFEFTHQSEQVNGIDVLETETLDAAGFRWSPVAIRMREGLPSYMIPSCWIAIKRVPLNTSGKVNRSRLSAWISHLPSDHRNIFTPQQLETGVIPADDVIALAISGKVVGLVSQGHNSQRSTIYGQDVNLTSIGIDSIKMMSLAAFLKNSYGVPVPMKLLMNHHTNITDISNHIYETRASKEGPSKEKSFHVDLISEFSLLDSQLESLHNSLGVVFLTGGTGFLGTEILRQLLNNCGVVKVIVHARGDDHDQAKERLIQTATAARWWSAKFQEKIEIWTGDLSLPKLGLSMKEWKSLRKVDSIVHNGAFVNWNADYHTLKPTNVNSTVEILKAIGIAASPPKFVYVSGGRSFEDDDKTAAVKLASLDGYSQTKFMSEMLIRSFAKRDIASGCTSQISIVKPGLIIGTEQEGIANEGDFLWRYVAGAVRIGLYPKPADDGWLVVSSVDRVTSKIIEALVNPAFTVDHEKCVEVIDGVRMQDLWNIVNSHLAANNQLKPVSPQEWWRSIQKDIEARAEKHSLWPVQHLLLPEGNLGMDRKPEEVDEHRLKTVISRNVEHLVDTYFFS